MRMLLSTAGAAVVAGSIALAGLAITDARADGELNVLTWEGYTDPSFVSTFEEQTGCKLTPTYVGSNDEFPAKLAGGGSAYDLVSPSIDTTSILMKMGVVEAIDTSRIEGYENVYENFRTHPGITDADGNTYGIPYTWGSIPFMYRVDSFTTPPTSFADLFDPALAGKVSLWDDKTNIYVTARMLFGSDADVFNLSDDQLAQVRDKLIEMKPQIRKYWSTAGELVNLYANGEVTVSNTWGGYQSSLLADQGIEMVEFIPTENADGWADSWQLVKGTPNEDCAYKWLNFTLSPEGQCGVVGITGYSGSNPEALKTCLSDEEFAGLHQDDFNYIDSLDLWQEPGDVGAYIATWNAVKAAQ
jgi:spermidine/putrescine-binding protein